MVPNLGPTKPKHMPASYLQFTFAPVVLGNLLLCFLMEVVAIALDNKTTRWTTIGGARIESHRALRLSHLN
jgi:hypothetical protein